MTYSFFFLILPFLTVARAANDWTKPCVSGVCSWDLPSTNGSTPSGSLKIWGSQTAISDITEAAGWKILGCDPDALTQDIRLVCMGEDMCQHLYEGHGAVDTIVRLPASCGKGPFARIAKTWVSQDQSLPASLAARIVRRTGADPQVQALTLDTNFAAADNAKTGAVNLAIMGANVPGINDILANDPSVTASQRRSRMNKRGLTNFVSKAAKSISDAVSGVNTVDINKSKALPAVDFSKKANLFSQSLSCPPITAKMSVDVDATAHAVVTLGVAASGTIVPPKITDFSIITSLTADLNGELDLTADLSGSLSSPSIKLFEAGIPGLDFPGILSVGPTFAVTANAKATLDLNVDMKVGLNYHIDKAQLVFPPNGQKASGFSLGQTPLKLSADTKAAATGTVEGHIVPAINLGISALGVVDATVFLNLDASATMTLKVDAQAGASATVQQAKTKRQDEFGFDDEFSDADDNSASEDDSEDAGTDGEDSEDASDFFGGSDDFSSAADDSEDPSGETEPASDDNQDASEETQDVSDDTEDTSDDFGDDFSDQDTDDTQDALEDSQDVSDDTEDTSDDFGDDFSDGASADAGSDSVDADAETGDFDFDPTTTDSDDDTDSHHDFDFDQTADDEDTSADTDADADPTDDSSDDVFADEDSADGAQTADDETDDASGIVDDGVSADDQDTSADDSESTDDSADADSADADAAASTTATESAASTDSDDAHTSASLDAPAAASKVAVSTDSSASFGGSFVISAGLDVNAGATGSFFGLFDKSTKVSLFKKNFELLRKTFGASSGIKRGFSTRRIPRAARLALQSRALSCLAKASAPVALADQSIAAKSL